MEKRLESRRETIGSPKLHCHGDFCYPVKSVTPRIRFPYSNRNLNSIALPAEFPYKHGDISRSQ